MSVAFTRRLTSCVSGRFELGEDRVHVLLDRSLGQHERLGDRAVALARGDLGEQLALARRSAATAGTCAARERASISTSTIIGSITEPPRATALIASMQLLLVADPLLEQIRAAARALLEQAERVGGLGVLAEHDDADLGCVSRSALAIRTPSSAPDGGMRMSVRTTSGSHVSIAVWSSLPLVQTATSSMSGAALRVAVRNSRIT